MYGGQCADTTEVAVFGVMPLLTELVPKGARELYTWRS
jgi:hypothetical protein